MVLYISITFPPLFQNFSRGGRRNGSPKYATTCNERIQIPSVNNAQYTASSVQSSDEYLISTTIGQRRNAVDDFNFRQKTGLIMHHTTTRHIKLLKTWTFHLTHTSIL